MADEMPPQDFSYRTPAGAPMPPAAQPSPLRRAWTDIVRSSGKGAIVLKLAALRFVPGIGGMVMNGYAYTWAREQALGSHRPLPTKIVRPGVLDNGLYIYGISWIVAAALLVGAVAVGVALDALALDAVFWLVALVVFVCASPFLAIMNLRAAICGRIRSGLNLRRVWDLFSAPGKMLGAFAACWVPALVACALIAALVGAVVVVCLLGSGAFAIIAALGADGAALVEAATAHLEGYALILVPVVIALMYLVFFIVTIAQIVAARALGYWMADFRPTEWSEYLDNAKYYLDNAV